MYFGAPGSQGQPIAFEPAPGPALLPDRPLNLLGSINGQPVRNDDSSSPAYLGSGDGSTPPEQYLAYDPADPGSTEAIPPGGPVILKNKVRLCQCQILRNNVPLCCDVGLTSVCPAACCVQMHSSGSMQLYPSNPSAWPLLACRFGQHAHLHCTTLDHYQPCLAPLHCISHQPCTECMCCIKAIQTAAHAGRQTLACCGLFQSLQYSHQMPCPPTGHRQVLQDFTPPCQILLRQGHDRAAASDGAASKGTPTKQCNKQQQHRRSHQWHHYQRRAVWGKQQLRQWSGSDKRQQQQWRNRRQPKQQHQQL
jgi:hypothetical protein